MIQLRHRQHLTAFVISREEAVITPVTLVELETAIPRTGLPHPWYSNTEFASCIDTQTAGSQRREDG
jgi:hypothetical protein